MPKFIHAADLHVDSPLVGLAAYEGAPVDRIRGATRRALENLVQLAIDEQVRFVVIAGDVYDTRPLGQSALFFRAQMQRLADAGIPVVIVRGNHDHAGIAPPNVRLPENVRVLAHEQAERVEVVDGVFVHGRSYPRPDYTDDLVVSYPAAVDGALNVGLLHTALTGSPPHNPYAPTSPAALAAKEYQYWALGHVHEHRSWLERGSHIVFSGNLQGRHIRETGPKGAVVVEYEGPRILSWRHQPLDVMRWHHVEVKVQPGEELEAAVAQRVLEKTAADREAGLLCAARVTVTAAQEPSFDLRERLIGEVQVAGDLLWLEKVRLQVDAGIGLGRELLVQLRTVAGELADDDAMREALESELESVRQLLRKSDPDLVSRSELLDGSGGVAELLDRALEIVSAELG